MFCLAKGHSQAAFSLWNNMFEPIGSKRESWHMNQSLKCPTKEYPYIFTSKNSVNASVELETTTTRVPIVNNSTASVNITNNQTSIINSNTTVFINITINNQTSTTGYSSTSIIDDNTTNSILTTDVSTKSHRTRKQGRGKKNGDSDSSINKMKFIAIIGFLFLLTVILVVGFLRRRKTNQFIPTDSENPNYIDDDMDDDMDDEVYTQPKKNSNDDYYNNALPKTHGTRMSFE